MSSAETLGSSSGSDARSRILPLLLDHLLLLVLLDHHGLLLSHQSLLLLFVHLVHLLLNIFCFHTFLLLNWLFLHHLSVKLLLDVGLNSLIWLDLLLLHHHELLLLLEQGLELLLVQLIQEVFGQNRHFNQTVASLLGILRFLAWLCRAWLGQFLLGKRGRILNRAESLPLTSACFALAERGMFVALRHAKAGEHLGLLRDDHAMGVGHEVALAALHPVRGCATKGFAHKVVPLCSRWPSCLHHPRVLAWLGGTWSLLAASFPEVQAFRSTKPAVRITVLVDVMADGVDALFDLVDLSWPSWESRWSLRSGVLLLLWSFLHLRRLLLLSVHHLLNLSIVGIDVNQISKLVSLFVLRVENLLVILVELFVALLILDLDDFLGLILEFGIIVDVLLSSMDVVVVLDDHSALVDVLMSHKLLWRLFFPFHDLLSFLDLLHLVHLVDQLLVVFQELFDDFLGHWQLVWVLLVLVLKVLDENGLLVVVKVINVDELVFILFSLGRKLFLASELLVILVLLQFTLELIVTFYLVSSTVDLLLPIHHLSKLSSFVSFLLVLLFPFELLFSVVLLFVLVHLLLKCSDSFIIKA